MLGANRFMGDLAERLGENAAPYRERAERILAAMQEKLWMPERGVFAEYLDTRGHEMLHAEPELPTIYHAAESGAADSLQIARMLQWADANLKTESTAGGGSLIWSSNWHPNHADSYTHSTHELAYAEVLHFAVTNYLAGRADSAYAILRGVVCGVFKGPTPGGLSCHTFTDGRQRANDEFADAISMWGRAVVEGMFGIRPNKPAGHVVLSPQFPSDWPDASIKSPVLSYTWHREDGTISIAWSSPTESAVLLRLPLPATSVEAALVDGTPAEFAIEPGYAGVNWLLLETPQAGMGTIRIEYSPGSVEPVPSAPKRTESRTTAVPWSPPGPEASDITRWTLVDLGAVYNARLTEVLPRVLEGTKPPEPPASQVGFGYWKDHIRQGPGSRNQDISDAAWRAKVGADGIAWTADGIPFRTAKEGPNIGVVTRSGVFPEVIRVPIAAQGKSLYLMLSGITFPVQSHVVNVRLSMHYADGEVAARDLVNPFLKSAIAGAPGAAASTIHPRTASRISVDEPAPLVRLRWMTLRSPLPSTRRPISCASISGVTSNSRVLP